MNYPSRQDVMQPRIFLIDDDESVLKTCERFFADLSWSVDLAESAEKALELMNDRYDIVLLDFYLPGMNGLDFLAILRERWPAVSVIMITGYGTIEMAVEAMKLGAEDFILKPIDLEYMKITMERVLHEREMKDEVKKLRWINDKLEELRKMKNKFIDITSHELRTPLGNIISYAELIQEAADSDKQTREKFLNVILQCAYRLKKVVDDMHECLIEKDWNGVLNYGTFDVVQLMKELEFEFQPIAQNRKILFAVAYDFADLQWNGDLQRIQRALRELLKNAIRFTPDGGNVSFTCEKRDKTLVFEIRDSGVGIDPREKENIFELFYEAQNTLHHSTSESAFLGAGIGLGLNIARSIVEAHGGEIKVSNNIENGSTFVVELPKIELNDS